MLTFSVLASSSQGNSSLVSLRDGDGTHERDPVYRHLLVDAGLSPRRTANLLAEHGLTLDDISDILVTHLDHDHFRPTWAGAAMKHGITIHASRRHRSRLFRTGICASRVNLFESGFELGVDTAVDIAHFAHDAHGSAGFVIEHCGARLGWATDLGRAPRTMTEVFADLDALAIESNYDPQMQRQSIRPATLIRRVMGGAGHLSNDQSLQAVRRIARTSRLSHVVALHLSQECNSPAIVRGVYARSAPELLDKLIIATPDTPTQMLEVKPASRCRQLTMWPV